MPEHTTIIGVDCASDPKNVGIAFGTYAQGQTVVEYVEMGSALSPPSNRIASRLVDESGPVLIALDAPLGWPEPLARELHHHMAGDPFCAGANALFRRETDRHIKKRLGKQSLDVGADRIARTAHAALALLAALRQELNVPISLAWTPSVNGVQAIEVYPAATLLAHDIRTKGYKAPSGHTQRLHILDAINTRITVAAHVPDLETRADALDAVCCLLAAHDFLSGRAVPPEPNMPIHKEGWIWVS